MPTAVQASTRPASSRQRRPTEKVTHRTAEKEDAARRKAENLKKAHKAAQRQRRRERELAGSNASSGNEEVYSSDVDNIEDTMVSAHQASFTDRTVTTKLSTNTSLAFRASKIPPKPLTSSRKENTASRVDSAGSNKKRGEDSEDEVDKNHHLEHGDQDEDSPDDMAVVHKPRKRALPTSDGDSGDDDHGSDDRNALHPKMQKANDGSGRPKAADFDDITQEVLGIAVAIFRCLICTQAPFPDTTAIEIDMAKRAWREACEKTSLNVMLTPTLLKMITRRTSHVRGELKGKTRALVQSFYGFRSGQNKRIIARNHQLAEDLKEDYLFVYEDFKKRTGLYKTDILSMIIGDMWFSNKQDEGVLYHEYFNPMPKATMALIFAAIECSIDEWATGIKEDVKFTTTAYKDVFNAHLQCLDAFDEHTRAHGILGQLCAKLHTDARFHAGAETVSKLALPALGREAFDAAIREFQGSETEPETGDEAGAGAES
ncbi:hypothetical protein B0H21DRAFT_705828 [Amylocystis lapponica]|nr:hypothetical protein B0H21DRAFT_705828 [Amylocystis lapponica]